MLVQRRDLTEDELYFIKYTCVYHYDLSNRVREQLRDKIKALDVNDGAKSFALIAFCAPLDEMVVKYLGPKLFDPGEKYRVKENIEFYEVLPSGDVLLPYALARLLLNKNFNFDIPYPTIGRNFIGSLREYQIPLIKSMTEHLEKSGTTTMNVYPGAGKTVMGIWLSCWSKKVTCILITLTTLIKSWKTTIERYTDMKLWIVDDDDIPDDVDVIICMDERLHKIPKKLRERIGTLILDEAHLFCVPSRRTKWLAFQPRYLIIETATLKRPEDNMERMAYASAGLWGVTLRSSKPFNIYPIKTGLKGERVKNKLGTTDFGKLLQSILYREDVYIHILNIVRKHLNGRVLILTKETDHAKRVSEYLIHSGYKTSEYYGPMKSYKHSNILIGTPGKMGTGFDEATFDEDFTGEPVDVLILTSTIRKPTTLEQNVGRVLRADAPTVYVLIHDDSIFAGHWYIMKWYFTEFTSGKVIV